MCVVRVPAIFFVSPKHMCLPKLASVCDSVCVCVCVVTWDVRNPQRLKKGFWSMGSGLRVGCVCVCVCVCMCVWSPGRSETRIDLVTAFVLGFRSAHGLCECVYDHSARKKICSPKRKLLGKVSKCVFVWCGNNDATCLFCYPDKNMLGKVSKCVRGLRARVVSVCV